MVSARSESHTMHHEIWATADGGDDTPGSGVYELFYGVMMLIA